MDDQTAYRCDDPEVLATYDHIWKERASWSRGIVRAAKRLGKNQGVSVSTFMTTHVRGLLADDPADPPDGWVYVKSWNCLRPRRGKPGEPARAWLEQWKAPRDPLSFLTDNGLASFGRRPTGTNDFSEYLATPRVVVHSDTIWALYHGTPESPIGKPWRQAKLSEYFAAQEASDANAKPKRRKSA